MGGKEQKDCCTDVVLLMIARRYQELPEILFRQKEKALGQGHIGVSCIEKMFADLL